MASIIVLYVLIAVDTIEHQCFGLIKNLLSSSKVDKCCMFKMSTNFTKISSKVDKCCMFKINV